MTTVATFIAGLIAGIVWHAIATRSDRANMQADLDSQGSLLDSYRRANVRLVDYIRGRWDGLSTGWDDYGYEHESTPVYEAVAVERFVAGLDDTLERILDGGEL